MSQTAMDERPGAWTPEEILSQMELILASRHFHQARSLERFLRYVVTQTLTGGEQGLKEYAIGVEVFQRGSEFAPTADAVVRVQAGKLRKKLSSYYTDEGAADALLIELPKGHYVPRFTRRAAEAIQPPAPVPPITSPEPEGRAVANSKSGMSGVLRVAAVFLVGLATAVVFQRWGGLAAPGPGNFRAEATSAPRPPALNPDLLPLWGKFLEPQAANVLAYGTPQFFNAAGVYYRDVQVNSAAEMAGSKHLQTIQKGTGQPLTPTEIYTGVGETQGIYLLSRFMLKNSGDLRVSRSRLLGWDDVKNSNLIFLTSMRFHTLADELAYPSDFKFVPDGEGQLINQRPQPGEEREYQRGTFSGAVSDYALVTLWPGKSPHRRILHLSGYTTWATLAAAEFVTSPERLLELSGHLRQCSERAGQREHAPFFQILLRVEVKDNQPVSVSYVTHHDLEVKESAGELSARLRPDPPRQAR